MDEPRSFEIARQTNGLWSASAPDVSELEFVVAREPDEALRALVDWLYPHLRGGSDD